MEKKYASLRIILFSLNEDGLKRVNYQFKMYCCIIDL